MSPHRMLLASLLAAALALAPSVAFATRTCEDGCSWEQDGCIFQLTPLPDGEHMQWECPEGSNGSFVPSGSIQYYCCDNPY